MARVALVLLALLGVLAPSADARTTTARDGDVVATLRYTQHDFRTEAQRLTITRAGQTLVETRPHPKACGQIDCGPVPATLKPLRVRDVDGDGEPEVIYTAYTGGAHCCTVAEVYAFDGDGYTPVSFNFADSGFVLRDFGSDRNLEWVSRDPAFDYAFTAYAFAGKPIQIFHFTGGRFSDVTRSFRRPLRRDARLWMKYYHRTRHRHDGVEYGPLAAWAADRYLLGRRDATLRFLRREAARGLLQPRGARFVARLDGFLLRHGYG